VLPAKPLNKKGPLSYGSFLQGEKAGKLNYKQK